MLEGRDEPDDVFWRIQRGLCGYVSYLAACEMQTSFSEYVLYEPTLRILSARGYVARCEEECQNWVYDRGGDKKRIDFYAEGHEMRLGIEMKWTDEPVVQIGNDIQKLCTFMRTTGNRGFLIIFGVIRALKDVDLRTVGYELPKYELVKVGDWEKVDFKRTQYSCLVYEVTFRFGQNPIPRFDRWIFDML
jgi:hypothetical protein